MAIKTLIKTAPELRDVIRVSQSFKVENMAADLNWAEEMFIIPAIGREQYNELLDAYHEVPMVLPAYLEKLLAHCQKCDANFAAGKYIILGQVQLDSSGVSIITDENRKTAFQWQIEDVTQEYCAEKAFDFLDIMLTFLEENKADYPLWVNSDAYTESKQFLITSAKTFHRFVDINRSRQTFMRLWQSMKKVQDNIIEPALGLEFFGDLMTKFTSGSLNSQEEKLVGMLQPALAFHASADAILSLPMRIRHASLVLDFLLAQNSTIKESKRPSTTQLSSAYEKHLHNGDAYLRRATDYLQSTASPSVFPIFYNSSLYLKGAKPDNTIPNSSENATFFL